MVNRVFISRRGRESEPARLTAPPIPLNADVTVLLLLPHVVVERMALNAVDELIIPDEVKEDVTVIGPKVFPPVLVPDAGIHFPPCVISGIVLAMYGIPSVVEVKP